MKTKVFENIKEVIAGLMLLLLLTSSHSLADEDDKTLKVGIYDNSPLIFSTQDNQASGLFADILRYISEQEGWNIEYVYASFDELLTRLEQRQVDLVPVVAYSALRSQRFDFNQENILTNWGQVYAAPNSPLRNLTDLSNKKVAVLKQDIHGKVFSQLIEKFGIQSELIVADSYHDVFRLISENRVDAGVVNRLFGQQFAGQYEISKTSIIFNPIKIHFAFPRQHNSGYLDTIDKYLTAMKQQDGSLYYRSVQKWLGEEVSVKSIAPVLLSILLGLSILVFLIYLLLQLKSIRRALGLTEIIDDGVVFNVQLITFLSAVVCWGVISYLDYRWFNPGNAELSDFVFPVFDQHRLVFRMMFVATILLSGIVVSRIFSRLLTGQHLIQQSEHRFRLTTQAGKTGVWDWDIKTDVMHLDPYLKEMLGYKDDEIDNHMDDWARHVHPGDRNKIAIAIKQVMDNTVSDLYVEHRMFHKKGHEVWFLAHGSVIRDEDNRPCRMVGTDTDITERKLAEQSLLESKNLLHTIINTLPDLIWLKDVDGTYLACNLKFETLFGVKEEKLVGKTDYDFVDKELADFFRAKDKEAIALGRPNINEEVVPFADGHEEFLETIKTPMFDAEGGLIGVIGIGRDITQRKKAEQKILHQAHFDNLTDLPNRFLSLDRLSQLLSEAERDKTLVAVIFIDLDDFKKVNDSLGHESGDKLLIEVAKRLKTVLRGSDTVGRLAGDEFIALLGGIEHADDAKPVVKNLISQFKAPFSIDDRELLLSSSIGIAVYPQDGLSASELLRNSDSAMYYAKQQGRNTYSFFTQAMNRDMTRRLALEEQIHGALDRAEFEVYYQPKISVADGRVTGAEALLRWYNPSLGHVSPVEFIPIAEQTGLIVPLGEFVLQQAMLQVADWKKLADGEFRVAVNISPRQFRDPSLLSSIQQALEDSGQGGEQLELEITEGVLMIGHGEVDSVLASINRLGITLAMDDFGTGYSSLNYLRLYPFDVLKIDQGFIRDITEDSADRELISAAIAMAHGLKLKVVAEGVETAEQFAYLKSVNCDYAQGYLFGKPMTAMELSGGISQDTD